MITHLSEETCGTYGCYKKLDNGANCGGFRTQKQRNGDIKTWYICKQCGNQSIPGTRKLKLYQQTHYYTKPETGYNITNKEINHKRQWNQLVTSLTKDNEPTNETNDKKMPEWDQVLERMEKNKEAKE